MKRIATLGLAAALLLALAAIPAQAAVKEVNAGVNAVAWDEEFVWDGQNFAACDVRTYDWGDDPRVDLSCNGDPGYGSAWVRVRVPGVRGKVTGVRAELTGDCSNNRNVSWKKKRSKVLVTVSIHADPFCQVRTIRVSYS
jgi:hypothetical protein